MQIAVAVSLRILIFSTCSSGCNLALPPYSFNVSIFAYSISNIYHPKPANKLAGVFWRWHGAGSPAGGGGVTPHPCPEHVTNHHPKHLFFLLPAPCRLQHGCSCVDCKCNEPPGDCSNLGRRLEGRGIQTHANGTRVLFHQRQMKEDVCNRLARRSESRPMPRDIFHTPRPLP